jgi:hypothetical protein
VIRKGEVFKHYKPRGNIYKVMLIVEPIHKMTENETVTYTMKAVYTEEDNPILEVLFSERGAYIKGDKRYVLYIACDGKDETMWAREYNNFVEEVEVENYVIPRFKNMDLSTTLNSYRDGYSQGGFDTGLEVLYGRNLKGVGLIQHKELIVGLLENSNISEKDKGDVVNELDNLIEHVHNVMKR